MTRVRTVGEVYFTYWDAEKHLLPMSKGLKKDCEMKVQQISHFQKVCKLFTAIFLILQRTMYPLPKLISKKRLRYRPYASWISFAQVHHFVAFFFFSPKSVVSYTIHRIHSIQFEKIFQIITFILFQRLVHGGALDEKHWWEYKKKKKLKKLTLYFFSNSLTVFFPSFFCFTPITPSVIKVRI